MHLTVGNGAKNKVKCLGLPKKVVRTNEIARYSTSLTTVKFVYLYSSICVLFELSLLENVLSVAYMHCHKACTSPDLIHLLVRGRGLGTRLVHTYRKLLDYYVRFAAGGIKEQIQTSELRPASETGRP